MGCVARHRTQLWWDLPVIESFELLRDIYRIEFPKSRLASGERDDGQYPLSIYRSWFRNLFTFVIPLGCGN